MEPGGFKPL